jgi:hypothetical protein
MEPKNTLHVQTVDVLTFIKAVYIVTNVILKH